MEALTHRGEAREASGLQRFAARAGAPSLAAAGVYLTLQLIAAQNSRPAAIAVGLVGVLTTNGVAVWVGSPPRTRRSGPTGVVTFLFTDIEGSTGMWEHTPEQMCLALRRHDLILHTAIAEHGGFVFATAGDGVAAAFESPADAVGAAMAAQQALHAEDWPSRAALRVRMGIHLGSAEERDGDYFGSPVNRAARVMSAAAPGTVAVTDEVVQALEPHERVEFADLGPHRLRGLGRQIRLHRAGPPAGVEPPRQRRGA